MRKTLFETLTKDEILAYEAWSKLEIYEAYVITSVKLDQTNKEIKRLGVIVAGLEHDLKKAKDVEDD